jgi:hypothetical protein
MNENGNNGRGGRPKTESLKGCFVLQRQFAHIGHAIACHLQERYGITQFCGYVHRRTSYDYLISQRDFIYSTLLLDEEIHDRYKQEKLDPYFLNELERTYGIPSLWPFLAVDRVIMSNQLIREYPYDRSKYSHEEMLRILQVHARAIIDMLDRERPDFLVCSVLGSVGSLLLYYIAKARGIRTFFLNTACIRDRFIFSETYNNFSWVDELTTNKREELKESPQWKEAREYLEQFRAQPIPYYKDTTPVSQPVTRRKQLKFFSPKIAYRSGKEFVKSVIVHFRSNERRDYSYIGPWNYLKDMLKRKIRNAIGLEDLYDEFDPSVDYVFFPLHYEPEVQLLLLAPYQTDQISVIKDVARSLPVQYKLVVKEHPAMVEYRPRSYYKALKKIPNVLLVKPTLSSFSIIPKAKMIFIITGTVGWEALMLRIPVITFGHIFFNPLPMVTHCTDIETLPSLIVQKLQNPSHDEEALVAFLAALLKDSATVDLPYLWIHESDLEKKKAGIKPLADLLAKKLNIS